MGRLQPKDYSRCNKECKGNQGCLYCWRKANAKESNKEDTSPEGNPDAKPEQGYLKLVSGSPSCEEAGGE